ncbi:uncharacterized protein LOC103278711 isoform X2 [Anolis carolinensis]|uniref:uncharacterized protein LOC103278711 isoform X2 n=1 Tax=Anolis carolinensis TaxID=28377 RepID=UPI0007DB878D|nr:PREDICTED: uncharacterized protein LOC103278711 isoform X2 [Anolis carolinensis]|eukprot:XP_016848781.1 PREDICTED: uncharacterized protein LOC103278711 isoform X2 [Anolis carolinensis]
MMGFSGLQLRCLILTGLFMSGEIHSSPVSVSPYFADNARGSSEEVVLTQGMSLRITAFCAYQYLQGDKIWCKETEQKECDLNKSFSLSEWKFLSTIPNQKITLESPRNGCLSLFMTALEVEDSGTYWFGLLDGLKMISSKKIKVVVHENPLVPTMIFSPPTSMTPSSESPNKSGRRLQEVIKVQGESLIMKAFCSQQHQSKKIWCKGDILKECDLDKPVGISATGWQYLTPKPNQKVILLDSGNGCSYFFISDLHMDDSGIYWFGILEDLNIIPLRKFKVIVQKRQKNNGIVAVTSEDYQRPEPSVTIPISSEPQVYQVILVLGSIVVGITIIAALILVVTMLLKRKMRAEELNFGDDPNCRVITLQIHDVQAARHSSSKEINAIYAIPNKPKTRIEDVTYVNTKFPQRSNIIKHHSEPHCVLPSPGSVEYANIIFGSRIPHIRD